MHQQPCLLVSIAACIRAALLICTVVSPEVAQEIDPHDQFFLSEGVDRADVIAVGTFHVTWKYPWFDGWRYGGTLELEESLLPGRLKARTIPFRWNEPYGSTCFVCDKLSRFDGKRGIWLILEKDSRHILSGTAADFCGGPLPMNCRDLVCDAIKRRKSQARKGGGR